MLPPNYKGYEVLERNDAKVSRSVLRRGRASNRPYLVDPKHFVIPMIISVYIDHFLAYGDLLSDPILALLPGKTHPHLVISSA